MITAATTAKSMAKAIDGFADAYEALTPDVIVILGDRYEMLAAASAALLFRIPIRYLLHTFMVVRSQRVLSMMPSVMPSAR